MLATSRAPFVPKNSRIRLGRRAAVTCAAALGLSAITSTAAANRCTNPATHWPDTLYCQVQGAVPRTAPPALPATPATPAELKDFWLYFLPQSYSEQGDPVRCLDGTRPAIWVDKATDGTTDIESNRWLITFRGGGSCNSAAGGQSCIDDYAKPMERDEMSTAGIPALTTSFGGLLAPAASNAFREYNRIQIHKCSYDRFNGRSLSLEAGVHPTTGAAVTYDLYQQGFDIAKAALLALQNGLAYEQYVPDGAGGVVPQNVTLPPLVDAEKVVFYGHSGGAHGLMHNIDHFADTLGGWTRTDGADFSGDVRAVFDANFPPAPEAESAHWSPAGGDVWDEITAGTIAGGADFDYDKSTFQPGGDHELQLASWSTRRDESCWQVHVTGAASAEPEHCNDRHHVLFHHTRTPFFIRQDLEDPNAGHVNGGAGHTVRWSTGGAYAVMSPEDYEERVSRQMMDLMGGATRSELSPFCAPNECDDSGTFPTYFAIAPRCKKHEGFLDSARIQTAMIGAGTSKTFHDLLLDFLALPRTGAGVHMIDGMGYSSDCR